MSEFPTIADLWNNYQQSPDVKSHVLHNMKILRCIRGGLKMAQAHRIAFDPRGEYWRRPERRLLVAYFAANWGDRMTPVAAVRSFAKKAFQHFDSLHERAVFRLQEPDFEPTPEALDQILEILLAECSSLQVGEIWDQLRKTWKNLKLPLTAAEHLAAFFRKAITTLKQTSGLEGELGCGFQSRLPWFPYLGYEDEISFATRQAFFFGFANLLTTSNAYIQGGSMVVAPMIQNTNSDAILDAFTSWGGDGVPGNPSLMAYGADDTEERDCSQYRPMLECYGFLNLERVPYYNQAASVYGEWIGAAKEAKPLEIIEAVGERVRAELLEGPTSTLIPILASTFRELFNQPAETRVWMEWTRESKAKALGESVKDLVDATLLKELQARAAFPATQSEVAAAMCLLHLMLDSRAYGLGKPGDPVVIPGDQTPVQSLSTPTLPDGLRPYGELALAVLKAKKHVLLAGAPGTGKTTLAQFLAQSWNDNEPCLKPSLGEKRPFMTVANSAWSPFHTIGGMFPDESGKPKACPGVFVDPGSAGPDGCWSLRPEAVIVDELNRADMDRCIGELYPLLSDSAPMVRPAGLPGVNAIKRAERFRVIATANMAMSDLVFPMSEGLARRFQLIELPGASLEDIGNYLKSVSKNDGRLEFAIEAVEIFFDVVKASGKLLAKDAKDADVTPRLRFGVGFFGLLRDWVSRDFILPADAQSASASSASVEDASAVLAQSLSTAALSKDLEAALRAFQSAK